MQPKIPPSLDARLQPHLQRVRDGTGSDHDILPAVFGLLLEQQHEMSLATAHAITSLAAETNVAAQATKQQLELVRAQQQEQEKLSASLGAEAKEDTQVSKQQFELVQTQQQEQEKLAVNNALKLGNALKGIAEHQAAIDARLGVMEAEIAKRANVALTIQVLGFIVLIGAIAFLLFRR